MERFWAKTRMDVSGCLIWTACKNEWGYGRFGVGGKNRHAHRVAYELAHGPIPAGLLVMHTCDNPACVNVGHLRLGTDADNVADMDKKGRANRTPKPHYKMTIEQVREVRSSTVSAVKLAAKFGVSRSAVTAVRRGVTWK